MRTELEDLVRIQALFDELLEVHDNIAMLLVFTHGTPAPDGATQRHAKDSMAAYDKNLVLSIALLGLGFWASTLRRGLGAIVRVVRRSTVFIEGTVEAAIARLTMELVGIDGEQLVRVYAALWDELQRSQPGLTGT